MDIDHARNTSHVVLDAFNQQLAEVKKTVNGRTLYPEMELLSSIQRNGLQIKP